MTDPTSLANVTRVLQRFDATPLSEFRDVAFALRIRCARCKRRADSHGPLGECNALRGGYQPYSLRLSWRADEEAVRG